MTWQDHLEVDPAIAHGQVRIRGTRVPVSVLIDNLADGEPEADIAAAVLRERIVPLPRDAA